jgi:hypothetical protein
MEHTRWCASIVLTPSDDFLFVILCLKTKICAYFLEIYCHTVMSNILVLFHFLGSLARG